MYKKYKHVFALTVLLTFVSWLDDQGSTPSRGNEGFFLFTTASRLALGCNLPPIQWVPRDLSLGVKQLVCEGDNLPLSSAKVKKA
jgi:hypothetical protein